MSPAVLHAASGTSGATASVYPAPLAALFLILLLVAASVWIGGWFSLVVIARSTAATLSPPDRVKFFRHFGKFYGAVSTTALSIALTFGLALLAGMPWTALSTWCVILSAILVGILLAGIVQARAQRRMRLELLTSGDETLRSKITSGARSAAVLRVSLGALSIAILVLGVLRTV